jgi:signal transduction histidine kinase
VTRRRALAVLAAAAALLVALNALVWSMYRSEVREVERGLDERLLALGRTAARSLGADRAPLLAALVAENRLEDAYLVDSALHVVAGVRTRAGTKLDLMRVDPDRLAAAQAGSASAGPGVSLDQAEIEAAYFPAGATTLVLEAGAEYREPAARLRTTYLVAVALTVLVAIVFAAALLLALRSLERARVAYGRAERLAAVGAMAAMVAHEVRNPLGILRGQVELARERLPEGAPERERERFAEMLAEIDRLNRITQEFLGLARDMPIERAPTELAALARAIIDDAKAGAKDATLEVQAPEAIEVSADAGKLRQAILNLVLNAVQIGGAGVTVRVEVARAGSRARVTIADDGPGVPADLAPTLFEPFVGGRKGGSGLGLAVARRIAERHDGTLELESTPGARGARFSIYLPLT